MKQIRFLFPVIAALMLVACKPSPQQAMEYNDKIIAEQIKIQNLDNEVLAALDEVDSTLGETKLKNYLEQIKASTEIVSKMEKFDGKDDFKNEALSFFAMYKAIGEMEYTQMLALVKGSERGEEVQQRYEALRQTMSDKYKAAHDKFDEAQKKFAGEYKFQLIAHS